MKVPEEYRIKKGYSPKNPELCTDASAGNNGAFYIARLDLLVIASDGGGWEHVSVSRGHSRRCPNWDEMCEVKRLFWGDDETVAQYHPKRSVYVNNCGNCLHLWKKVGAEFDLPPTWMVGFKGLGVLK